LHIAVGRSVCFRLRYNEHNTCDLSGAYHGYDGGDLRGTGRIHYKSIPHRAQAEENDLGSGVLSGM